MLDFLLICNRPSSNANAETISQHIDAIKNMSGFRVWELSTIGAIPNDLDLERFDAIGIHYTLHLSEPNDYFLDGKAMERISQFKGLKCIWLHDEYRRVNYVADKLAKMDMHVIFTLAEGEVKRALYPKTILPNTKIHTVFAGYISDDWLNYQLPAFHQREIDIGYRARRPPMWLGQLGQDKITIGTSFLEACQPLDLKLDISVEEQDRVYGAQWKQFLANCKAVLCVESGASVIDFTGELETQVDDFCAKNPDIEFDVVREKFLSKVDGVMSINPISPRIFEAACLKTLMIGYEGEYSGLMQPYVHYLPLKRDFSNLSEIVESLKNEEQCKTIIENAYRDLGSNPDYHEEQFSINCADILKQEMNDHEKKIKPAYSTTEYKTMLRKDPFQMYRHLLGNRLQKVLLSSKSRHRLFKIWYALPKPIQNGIRPMLKLIGR